MKYSFKMLKSIVFIMALFYSSLASASASTSINIFDITEGIVEKKNIINEVVNIKILGIDNDCYTWTIEDDVLDIVTCEGSNDYLLLFESNLVLYEFKIYNWSNKIIIWIDRNSYPNSILSLSSRECLKVYPITDFFSEEKNYILFDSVEIFDFKLDTIDIFFAKYIEGFEEIKIIDSLLSFHKTDLFSAGNRNDFSYFFENLLDEDLVISIIRKEIKWRKGRLYRAKKVTLYNYNVSINMSDKSSRIIITKKKYRVPKQGNFNYGKPSSVKVNEQAVNYYDLIPYIRCLNALALHKLDNQQLMDKTIRIDDDGRKMETTLTHIQPTEILIRYRGEDKRIIAIAPSYYYSKNPELHWQKNLFYKSYKLIINLFEIN